MPRRTQAAGQGELQLFYAGSLQRPMEAMRQEFAQRHPAVSIGCRAGGSTLLAKTIRTGQARADVLLSADYAVINDILLPDCASWNVLFTTNQMVLCHTAHSRYAAEINTDNWCDILQRPDVSWGHSAPEQDPCGYRSLLAMRLAEIHYGRNGLYAALIAGRPQENVSAKAANLVERLKTGQLDYAWEYLSVARQQQLPYVSLDPRINLGDFHLENVYQQAKIRIPGTTPDTDQELCGASITYGLTIPDNAPNRPAAIAFLEYLFDPQGGLAVLERMGQTPLSPVRLAGPAMEAALPATLRPLVQAV